MDKSALKETAGRLVAPGRGILAADESLPTIKKRFEAFGIKDSEENRRTYRELLFTTPGIEEFISGVIMFDETIHQKTKDGIYFSELLSKRGIIPGIKVDQGREEVVDSPGEYSTKGLTGLPERLKEYARLGAKFTKWRAVYVIGEKTPTVEVVAENAKRLAEFARISQAFGFVPIVEPEVLMQGGHEIKQSEEVTYLVLKKVFLELSRAGVFFEAMLLKPNWVHPGKDSGRKPADDEVARATLRVLKEVVPAEVPGIVFLSGGDSPEDSTAHLNAMNELDNVPWELSFSFGRALQKPVLKIWAGKEENIKKAQAVFYKRARLNSLARTGNYRREMDGI